MLSMNVFSQPSRWQRCWFSCLLTACAVNSSMPVPVMDSTSTDRSVSAAIVTPPSTNKHQHIVKQGDTLYGLSKIYNIPFKQLAAYNQLNPPYSLQTGQTLRLTDDTGKPASIEDKGTTIANEADVITGRITPPGIEVKPQINLNDTLKRQQPVTSSNPNAGPETGNASRMSSSAGRDKVRPAMPESESSALAATDYEKTADDAIRWQWPIKGKRVSGYDETSNKGLNIAGTPGQTVQAAASGKVIYSGADVRNTGKLIIIKHNSNLLSVYAHQGSTILPEGSMVRLGDTVATLPLTSKNPLILHFEIRYKGKPLDPAQLLPSRD